MTFAVYKKMIDDEIKLLINKKHDFDKIINEFREKNNVNELSLKGILNDILSQFEVCLKYTYISKKDKKLISAIKYANNIKKHSKSLFSYSLYSKGLYPSNNLYPSNYLFPSSFRIWWNELPLDDDEYEYQYKCYNKKLLNKDLPKSIDVIYDIIIIGCDNYERNSKKGRARNYKKK